MDITTVALAITVIRWLESHDSIKTDNARSEP